MVWEWDFVPGKFITGINVSHGTFACPCQSPQLIVLADPPLLLLELQGPCGTQEPHSPTTGTMQVPEVPQKLREPWIHPSSDLNYRSFASNS